MPWSIDTFRPYPRHTPIHLSVTTHLASCRLVSNYVHCCPTIVFSFSKYSFAVPPDVYLESPPNTQLVETSSRQITPRIIFVIIIIIIIVIINSFQNPATFHRLRVHFNVFVQNSYAFMRGEHSGGPSKKADRSERQKGW